MLLPPAGLGSIAMGRRKGVPYKPVLRRKPARATARPAGALGSPLRREFGLAKNLAQLLNCKDGAASRTLARLASTRAVQEQFAAPFHETWFKCKDGRSSRTLDRCVFGLATAPGVDDRLRRGSVFGEQSVAQRDRLRHEVPVGTEVGKPKGLLAGLPCAEDVPGTA